MTVKQRLRTVTRTASTLYLREEGSDDEIELELYHSPDGMFEPLVEKLPSGGYVVGYLVRDDDCENPLEACDGMGKILDGRRGSATAEEYRSKREDFDEVFDVLLDVYSHSGDAWRIHGGGRYFPDEQWDVSNGAGIWTPDKACREHIDMAATEAYLCPDPAIDAQRRWARSAEYPKPERPCREKPAAIGITSKLHSKETGEKYPNGNEKWRYWYTYGWQHVDGRKRGGYKTVLSAAKAAAKILGVPFDQVKYDIERREEALVCAYQAVETYNEWLSGDCWGVCTEVFTAAGEPVSQDAFWGCIGQQWAEGEVRTSMAHKCG